MANGIRTGNHRGFNKERSSKFRVLQTPEEGRRTYRPKRCGNNNKGEDDSPKNLNDKNDRVQVLNYGKKTRKTYNNLTLVHTDRLLSSRLRGGGQ